MDGAACADMDTSDFFPKRGHSLELAFHACARCPVRAECKELGRKEHGGIWGGEYHGKPAKCSDCGTMMVANVGRRSVCVECNGGPVEDPDEPYRPSIPGECYRCGEHFEPKQAHQRFCSRSCQRRFNETPPAPWRGVVKVCPGCGVEFEMRRSTQNACSKDCGRNHRRSKREEKMTIQ